MRELLYRYHGGTGMTLTALQQLFPSATPETWHQHINGGGSVENTAKVDATAYVGIDCIVLGNARVSGDAWVSGNAWEWSPLQIMGAKHFVSVSAYGMLSIGCQQHDIAWWKEHYRCGRQERRLRQEAGSGVSQLHRACAGVDEYPRG